jgi:hypothetical protein
MFGKKQRIAAGVVSLAAVGALAVVVSGAFAATSWTDTATINGQSFSPATEGGVKAVYSCNSSTGRWSAKITGVQVIDKDGVTPWPDYNIFLFLAGGPDHSVQFSHTLTQNSTNGLFVASFHGTMSPADIPDACAPGLSVSFINDQYPDDGLNSFGSLS